jgi:hypothetical protein
MVKKAKARAKSRGLPFDIDWKWMVKTFRSTTHCPVSGIEFDWKASNRDLSNCPSLDRFDNSRGYTKDNVNVISLKANSRKNDTSLEKLKMLASWVVDQLARIQP